MKKLKFTLAALILTSALAFTGCQDPSKTKRGDDSSQQSNESNVFLAAAVPGASEALTTSTSDVSSMPEIEESFASEPEVSSVPQGSCPDCDGTGHHNNTVCGTCNGSGLYHEHTAPQGSCPDCDGMGHHNNTVCGTCNGSGRYTVQSHHGGGHHQNRSHH